jgi:putative zinc finger protein
VTCATTTALGAYVLGALDAREREQVDEHVAICGRCREELEALIPLRSYLARVATEELETADTPSTAPEAPPVPGGRQPSPGVAPTALRTRLHDALRVERRRIARRRLATATALVAALAIALVAVSPDAGREPPARAVAADARTGVRATVTATSRAWGTELRVRMTGAAPGVRCRLIARARDGRSDVAATWWTTYGGNAEVSGAAAIPAAELVALDVVAAGGRRLVHVPMSGGGA